MANGGALNKHGLTAKQENFCQEYIKDFNATRAAKAAGYSEDTAYEIASQNLRKLEIQARLAQLTKKRMERLEITQDRVLEELSYIAFFDIRELFNDDGNLKQPHELDEKTARAIAAIDQGQEKSLRGDKDTLEYIKKIKSLDKKGALELLGKHLGMFADLVKVEHADAKFNQYLQALYDFLDDDGKAQFRAFSEQYRPESDSQADSNYSYN